LALLDVLQGRKTASEAGGVDEVLLDASQAIDKIEVIEVKVALQTLLKNATRTAGKLDDELGAVTKAIEAWFDDRMARASGWYKRKAQTVALVLAAVVVACSNADSISVATVLWRDSSTREAVVAEAKAYHDAHVPAPTDDATKARASGDPIKLLEESALPIGWTELPSDFLGGVLKLVGLALTTLAVSLGAGFWFDLLGRILQIRGTGPRISPVETPAKGKNG
jgi:hypothetical protein